MRHKEEIRETAFIVARENRAAGLDHVRPMPASAQLHFDALDLLDLLGAKDAEIEQLQAVAGKALDFLILVGEYNSRQAEEWALGTAMAYGEDANQLGDALEEVGL